jgi:hypothetical protein
MGGRVKASFPRTDKEVRAQNKSICFLLMVRESNECCHHLSKLVPNTLCQKTLPRTGVISILFLFSQGLERFECLTTAPLLCEHTHAF